MNLVRWAVTYVVAAVAINAAAPGLPWYIGIVLCWTACEWTLKRYDRTEETEART